MDWWSRAPRYRRREGNGRWSLVSRLAEQDLNGAEVNAGFQQVSGKGVPQGLLILLMICTQQRFAIGVIPSVA